MEKIIAKQNVTNGCRVYIENINGYCLDIGGILYFCTKQEGLKKAKESFETKKRTYGHKSWALYKLELNGFLSEEISSHKNSNDVFKQKRYELL